MKLPKIAIWGPIAWILLLFSIGEWRRLELWGLVVATLVLSSARDWTKRLYRGLLPVLLVGLFYDAMRFVKQVGLAPERVHSCDLQAFEARWFGLANGETVHPWLQAHAHPVLDVLAAIPYGTFLLASFACAAYLFWVDDAAMRRFTWSFFVLNLSAFVIHHAFPAAPPWYVHAHGCVIDPATVGNEGPNLARVDALMGLRYFHGFYAKSNDIFGAMPSLHVSYPLLILREGWRHFSKPVRVGAVAYFAAMVLAAVYLDHHWIADVVAGIALTLLVSVGVGRLLPEGRPPLELSEIRWQIAIWFGAGKAPRAPGTAGTLAALPIAAYLAHLGTPAVVVGALAVTPVAVWASYEAIRRTGKKDPQVVVVDEVAGMIVAVLSAPKSLAGLLVAFALFRLFDATKPFPARAAERLPGGNGVVFDDIVAGLQAAALVFLGQRMGLFL